MADRKARTPTLRERALRLLARREHTRVELARKLSPHAGDAGDVEGVIDDFERRGWLSERRAVEQRVHTLRKRYGALRIERDLRQKGVSGDAVEAALTELKGSELAAAREVWRRKFGGKQPQGAADRARQVRFLRGRGFDLDTIFRVIKGGEED